MVFDNLAASDNIRKVFLKNYETDAQIGVYASEHGRRQKVRLSIEALVPRTSLTPEGIEAVFNYDRLPEAIEAVLAEGHVELQEQLVGRIAQLLLAQNPEILGLRIRSEKTEAYPKAESAGIEEIFLRES